MSDCCDECDEAVVLRATGIAKCDKHGVMFLIAKEPDNPLFKETLSVMCMAHPEDQDYKVLWENLYGT